MIEQLQQKGLMCTVAKPIKEKLSVDIYAESDDGRAYAFEVRYKTTELRTVSTDGSVMELKHQGAQDIGRYDFIKDIVKLERAANLSPGLIGYAILITNDHLYWEEPKLAGTVDRRFRIHDGARLRGILEWSKLAGEGTVATREAPLELQGRYRLRWRHFAMPKSGQGGTFKSLIVKVKSVF